MTQTKNIPDVPVKSLDLSDLTDGFSPRARSEPLLSNVQKKTLEQGTAFPSREPGDRSRVQINVSFSREQSNRLKAFLVRDAYTTWSYGQAIEYLLDIEEKTRK